jgi:large subunit ribosomal protein L22
MDATAVSKHVGYPPRKVRQLADLVRGQKVDSAITTLRFTKRAASAAVRKTIQSAMHNLVVKHGGSVAAEDMIVKTILVDEGRTMYRIRPRAQGRAYRIRKRSSHIKVIVTLLEEKKMTQPKPTTATKAAKQPKQAKPAKSAKPARRSK